MKTIISYVLIVFSVFIHTSCGGSGAESQNYQDPTLETYNIKTIAILPIRNSYLNIGDAKEINRHFMSGLSRVNKKYVLIGPDEAIEKMNKDSLVEKYYNYVATYSTTGISNSEVVKKIGESISCDAIVQGEIYNVIKKDGHFGQNKGETRCNVRYSLISVKDGKTLWETTSEGYETTSTTLSDAPPVMNVVKLAMDKIIESIPKK